MRKAGATCITSQMGCIDGLISANTERETLQVDHLHACAPEQRLSPILQMRTLKFAEVVPGSIARTWHI